MITDAGIESMPIATRTFRIFLSSTFEDLKEERDTLQREVFRKLRAAWPRESFYFPAAVLRRRRPDTNSDRRLSYTSGHSDSN